MATQDSVMGLFTSPQQYQQALQTEALNQGVSLARLSPVERAAAMGYAGGANIGRGISGMMGVEDPQMKLAAARQQIMQQVNQNDPQSLAQAAQALNQAGDVQGARALAQASQDLALKQSQVTRNLREKPASTTELEKLQDLRAELVTQFGENDPRVKEVNAAIAKKTTGKSMGQEIAEGLSPALSAIAGAQAKKMGEAGGTDVGKQVAAVQGKYTALGSIKDAVDMLDKGIYSGGYGPMQEAAAKYSGGIIRKDRLANTQEFRAYIGDVVIPRLQEFGGNDSVEELNYLRSVMAGDTSMEGTAIKNILQKADRKIRAGIDRLEKQQTAVTSGQPLPVGAVSPKATKRFNPATGKVETIQ